LEIAKVISGELYPYLKEIKLVGRVREESDNDFIIYGCIRGYEDEFYKGILDYDKATEIMGFDSVEEVENFWTEARGMFLVLENDEYETTSRI